MVEPSIEIQAEVNLGPEPAVLYELFANSSYGEILKNESSRYDRYRPSSLPPEEWEKLLGPDVNMLEHMLVTHLETAYFLNACRASNPTPTELAFFSEFEERLLLRTAIIHDWGKAETKDMHYEFRTDAHRTTTRLATEKIWNEIVGSNQEELFARLYSIIENQDPKLGPAFDAIERQGRVQTALNAFVQSRLVNDGELTSKLQWLCAGVLANQLEPLQRYSTDYPSIQVFLDENRTVLSEAFQEISSGIFEANGQRDPQRLKSYVVTAAQWGSDKKILSLVQNGEGQSHLETRIVAASELKLLETIALEELVERLRRVTFRGLYNGHGQPLHPYVDADFHLATIYPQNTQAGTPVLHHDAKEEPIYTPQPTIYGNQVEVIRTVDFFLKEHGLSATRLEGGVSYEWQGRGKFHMLPPIIEKQIWDLSEGFIDLEKLAEQFEGTFVKDASGRLHAVSTRWLNNFYLDDISTTNMDIFHSNLPVLNYGQRYSGPWEFNVICDGAHRVNYAIEDQNAPISVIIVEPAPGKRLIPYYAVPMPLRPIIRLTSKRAEQMYAKLERDKFHIFNDLLRKTLHYDWTSGGLNVSSLRSQKDLAI